MSGLYGELLLHYGPPLALAGMCIWLLWRQPSKSKPTNPPHQPQPAGPSRPQAQQLEDVRAALIELDQRLRRCAEFSISAAEAYDSYYKEMVAQALNNEQG